MHASSCISRYLTLKTIKTTPKSSCAQLQGDGDRFSEEFPLSEVPPVLLARDSHSSQNTWVGHQLLVPTVGVGRDVGEKGNHPWSNSKGPGTSGLLRAKTGVKLCISGVSSKRQTNQRIANNRNVVCLRVVLARQEPQMSYATPKTTEAPERPPSHGFAKDNPIPYSQDRKGNDGLSLR